MLLRYLITAALLMHGVGHVLFLMNSWGLSRTDAGRSWLFSGNLGAGQTVEGIFGLLWLGPLIGFLVTGSFVVEQVFDIPGIGRFYVAGVLARDFPLLLGLTVVVTTAVVLANLVVDLLHGALDPRVRDARA